MLDSVFRSSLSALQRPKETNFFSHRNTHGADMELILRGVPTFDRKLQPEDILRKCCAAVRSLRQELLTLRREILMEVQGACGLLDQLAQNPPAHTIQDGILVAKLRAEVQRKGTTIEDNKKDLETLKIKMQWREKEWELRMESLKKVHNQREETLNTQVKTLQNLLNTYRRTKPSGGVYSTTNELATSPIPRISLNKHTLRSAHGNHNINDDDTESIITAPPWLENDGSTPVVAGSHLDHAGTQNKIRLWQSPPPTLKGYSMSARATSPASRPTRRTNSAQRDMSYRYATPR
eukprot:PhF_6_TR2194/c0_g1_i2/m.3635